MVKSSSIRKLKQHFYSGLISPIPKNNSPKQKSWSYSNFVSRPSPDGSAADMFVITGV